MSTFEKYNKIGTRVFDVDLKGITTWHKAKDLCACHIWKISKR